MCFGMRDASIGLPRCLGLPALNLRMVDALERDVGLPSGRGPAPARAERGWRAGARAAAPLAVAVGGFGISFGVLAKATGFGPLATIVMSATTFAGSAQFAIVSILAEGGAVASAIAAAVLLNARYLPIGVSVAPVMKGAWWRRFVEGQFVIDESWAVGSVGPGKFDRGRLMGAGLLLYATWVVTTTIGALGSSILEDPEALGLDAAFPALFLALLVSQLKGRRAIETAVLAATIALALVPLAPAGVPIVAASAASLLGLRSR